MKLTKRATTGYFKYCWLPTHLLALLCTPLIINSPEALWITLAGWIALGPIGLGVGYHRMLAHRSFEAPKVTRMILILLGSLSGQGKPIEFCLVHRHHHRLSDKETDVQSPNRGLIKSVFAWKFFSSDKFKLSVRDYKELSRDKFLKWIDRNYYVVYWSILSFVALINFEIFAFGLVFPSLIIFYEISVVDFLCHKRRLGYRNYDIHDQSVNNWWLSLPTFGLSLHNNHHAHPSSISYSTRWFEIDLGGLIAKMLRKSQRSDQDIPALSRK